MNELKTRIIASGFHFLEGPRWRDGWLWLSDLVRRKVYRASPDGKVEFVVDVPGRPSGLGFLPDGTALVVSMRDRRLFRIHDNELVLHADLSNLVEDELNDMVVDEKGRAYIGSFSFAIAARSHLREGSLVLIEPAGTARVVAAGLAFPNGCVITRDQRRLVLAETFGQRLTTFDIADDGGLQNRRVYANLGDVCPDGICMDSDGGIWVAAAESPEFIRVIEGGRMTHRVSTPHRQAVACQLGGPDGRTLFCLTADEAFEDVQNCPATANIEVTRVEIPGIAFS